MSILFFAIVALLAFANGANDNFKGVATLWGGGDLTYREAWCVANGATLLGAILAVFLGAAVAATFSGKGVVGADVLDSQAFAIAFAAGAALTVLLATVLHYPISTTHSILGSLAGAGMALAAGEVNFDTLIQKGAIPLLLSPAIAGGLTFILWKLRTLFFKSVFESAPAVKVSKPLHILSGASVCFSRAVNDTPKIASIALLGTAAGMSVVTIYAAIGVVMTLGGMLFVRKIAEVMSQKITGMTPAEGLTGNLVTAFLVIFASKMGLAVSTTHVSVGSLFGLGAVTGQGHLKKIIEIFLSWALTLPIAFGLAYTLAKALSSFT